MKTVIEMAREVWSAGGVYVGPPEKSLAQFADLVRADERENGQKWFDGVTAQYKQGILSEREACAKLVEENAKECDGLVGLVLQSNADAIRERGKK